jgi:hypothetical protein
MEPRVTCVHAIGGVCHNAKLPRVQVTVQACATCPHYRGPSRGLGDTVATVTKAVGIRPCGGCQKRREALNAAFPKLTQVP